MSPVQKRYLIVVDSTQSTAVAAYDVTAEIPAAPQGAQPISFYDAPREVTDYVADDITEEFVKAVRGS